MSNVIECAAPAALPKNLRVSPIHSWFARHDDVTSFVRQPEINRPEAAARIRASYGAGPTQEGWFGIAGGAAAVMRAVEHGWTAGADRLAVLSDAIAPPIGGTRRRLVRAEQGDELDVHAIYRGNLERGWSARRRERANRPSVTLASLVGESCSASADRIFWRGAAVARLADRLTEAGWQVAIVAVATCQGFVTAGDASSWFGHTIPVKAANAPLDLSQLAATICLPGFMRHCMFSALGSHPTKVAGEHCGSYMSRSAQEQMARALLVDHGYENAILVGADVGDQRSADAWIEGAVAKLAEGAA